MRILDDGSFLTAFHVQTSPEKTPYIWLAIDGDDRLCEVVAIPTEVQYSGFTMEPKTSTCTPQKWMLVPVDVIGEEHKKFACQSVEATDPDKLREIVFQGLCLCPNCLKRQN